MKRFFITAFIASATGAMAQEPADALRYSWSIQSGTARQQAVGGAMGSLGGDISANYVNPAGLGFYKTGDLVITPGYNFGNTKSTFMGRTEEKQKKNSFGMGTSGVVFGSGNSNKKGQRSSVFSLAVNRTANFGSNVLYFGQNNQSSYSQKFLEQIQNDGVKDANVVATNYEYGASLAFNTYWIDTIAGGTSGNYQFQTRSPIGTGLLQRQELINKGGLTELTMALAANWNDKIYAGGSIGVVFTNYERKSIFDEADATANPNNKFDYATFTENFSQNGAGIVFRGGVIYKPVEYFRLGLALHSPSLLTITDKYNSDVITNTESYQGEYSQTSQFLTGNENAIFKYNMVTPYKIIGSLSYVLREIEDVTKQKGFLTADIEYINYKAASFMELEADKNNPAIVNYLDDLNDAIDNAYKGTFNFRAGGELKFTTIMVRLGAAYYGNPYKNLAGEKGSKFQASGGLGYRNKGFFIDLTYIHTFIKDIHTPYRLQSGLTPLASIKGNMGNALLTFGIKI
ncbi:MAG: aromatic hydrocarbon degradation protein [Bacteroidetes bacterium]|nr:MAG: aromatic hydrocarbon degradation protein [Bacteroidota bacterium]